MSLRLRLTISFIVVVVVPLLVTLVFVRVKIAEQATARVAEKVTSFTTGSDRVMSQYTDRAALSATNFGVFPGVLAAVRDHKAAVIQATVDRFQPKFANSRLDFLAVVDAKGRRLGGIVNRNGTFRPGVVQPDLFTLAAAAAAGPICKQDFTPAQADGYSIRIVAPFCSQGGQEALGAVVAGYWLDETLLDSLPGDGQSQSTVVANGRIVATLLEDPKAEPLLAAFTGLPGQVKRVGSYEVAAVPVAGSKTLLLIAYPRSLIDQATKAGLPAITIIASAFVLLAGLLGFLLARVTTRPLIAFSEAALKVAGGKLDSRIEVKSRDEVGRLSMAFNTMTDELRSYISALQDSRDELKRNLTRLGDTLSSTHDLKRMLAVILETAMVTLRAEAGCLMLFSGNREELYLKVGRGLDGRVASANVRVRVGEGVSGKVAQTGEGVHGMAGPGGDLVMAPSEPRADSVVSVPLKSQGRVIGVLNLYDRVDADEFDDNDLATIRSFANQATVAIDNVLLHQEAQRLSITDGLTGLWNYRYFQMQFEREIEGATRFHRPLSLLILDLDKFKNVNDEYGHQRGDSVLIELATRVKGAIRDVDIFARYGGEEFVLVLPETDLEGARQTAEKICDLVRQRRFGTADEAPIRTTVSIGVAVFGEHGTTAAEMVKASDAALYAAKENGRDNWWVASGMTTEPTGAGPTLMTEREVAALSVAGLPVDDENDIDIADFAGPSVEPADDPPPTSLDEPAEDAPAHEPDVDEPAPPAVAVPVVASATSIRPNGHPVSGARYPARGAVRRTPSARAKLPKRGSGR